MNLESASREAKGLVIVPDMTGNHHPHQEERNNHNISRLKIKSSIFKPDVMWADSLSHRKQTEDTKRILAKLLNQGPSTSVFTFDQFKSTQCPPNYSQEIDLPLSLSGFLGN